MLSNTKGHLPLKYDQGRNHSIQKAFQVDQRNAYNELQAHWIPALQPNLSPW